jgi:endonuclease/exonuclease/phosphatase family metal-dependent hydrolase
MPRAPFPRPALFGAASAAGLLGLVIALVAQAQPALTQDATSTSTTPSTPPAANEGSRRFGSATPPARPARTIRLASYNIENLFDDHDDPALSGRYDDRDATKPAAHCAAAAAAINAINADIIALQEIESKQALLQFRDTYLKDLGYQHVTSLDAGDERGIEQAVLSRFPIRDVTQWIKSPLGGTHPAKFGRDPNDFAGQPISFHRSPLRVTIDVPASAAGTDTAAAQGYTLTLFVVHQKSGGPGAYWREREAAKTVELVREFQKTSPDANVVIAGDFNATADSKEMKVYFDAGLISALGDKAKGDPMFTTHSSGRAIDHLLFSPAAWNEVVPSTRFVLGTVDRPAGADWRTTPAPPGWASDHYPVVVDITPIDRDAPAK